jgi:tRNA(Ile)-lysidine synthase
MARRELGPASLAVVSAVDAAINSTEGPILVACSGGADSLALAAGAVRVARRRHQPVAAMVVDHGLQSDSAAVAAATREKLCQIGYTDVAVVQVVVDAFARAGREAAARAARYQALDERAAALGAVVLLGHTLDDQAETVLLGLARGSGARSLAGMAVRSGRYLRPLLGLTRKTTEAACTELGLQPWADPHNSDRSFARVRVREVVLPMLEKELGPGIAEALARTASLLADDADFLDQLADEIYPGTETMDCRFLISQPPALRRRLLLRWLREGGATDVTSFHLGRVEALVIQWHGQGPVQLSSAEVVREAGVLKISKPLSSVR